ncbi:unnamed protein product [Calicophoron daubneyi]|uniref:Uncharacterized protein n=1 Tax=Calicophoron daubneyi TaxID=300641 RepID=A0AAV2T513_CALDB
MTHSDNVTKIFREITRFKDLQKALDAAAKGIKALPDRVVYLNKIALLKHLSNLTIRSREITAYSTKFLDDLLELFHLRQQKLSSQSVSRLNSRLDYLMMAILREGSSPQDLGYSMGDLVRCSRTKALVIHTMDLFGPSRLKWHEQFIIGLQHYQWLQHMIEHLTPHNLDSSSQQLAGSFLALGPSTACYQSLNRLVAGCPQNIPDSPRSTGHGSLTRSELESNLCRGYCYNVIRGCLAPPLLFLPSRDDNIRYKRELVPWDLLLNSPGGDQPSSANRITTAFGAILASVNASDISRLISDGLRKAKREGRILQAKLKLFCGPPTLSKTHEATTEQNNEIEEDDSQTHVEVEREKLHEFMGQLSDQLTTLATERHDVEKFVKRAEKRFCRGSDPRILENNFSTQEDCWNGFEFGRYSKSVPPFTLIGQRANPEVIITNTDLQINPPAETKSAHERITVEMSRVEESQSDSSHDDPADDKNNGSNSKEKKDDPAAWRYDSPSSGLMPLPLNVDEFLTPIRPLTEDEERRVPDTGQRLIAEKEYPSPDSKCLPDDEDCRGMGKDNRLDTGQLTLPVTSTTVTTVIHIYSTPPSTESTKNTKITVTAAPIPLVSTGQTITAATNISERQISEGGRIHPPVQEQVSPTTQITTMNPEVSVAIGTPTLTVGSQSLGISSPRSEQLSPARSENSAKCSTIVSKLVLSLVLGLLLPVSMWL